MSTLTISSLVAQVQGTEVLRGIDLVVRSGEVHAVMGPNGAGKSSLANVLLGKPGYVVSSGSVDLDGADVLSLETWRRATAGLYLAPQDPVELPGVPLRSVLAEALSARGRAGDLAELAGVVAREAGAIGLPSALLERPVNVDASGGEKKRIETLQLAVLAPRIAVLDELDSGLDIDALRQIARRVEAEAHGGGSAGRDEPLGVLAITHYTRLLKELRPDAVHVLVGGRIVDSGGPELAGRIEAEGYRSYLAEGVPGEAAGLADLLAGPGGPGVTGRGPGR